MAAFEKGVEFLYNMGFFSFLAALLVFTISYYFFVSLTRKYTNREPKKYEKIVFFIFAILIASLMFILSFWEDMTIIVTYVAVAFFVIVLFLLLMVLFASFFGKPSWKFWETGRLKNMCPK